MKSTNPIFIYKIFLILCLLTLGTIYSQDKKASSKTLFNKSILPGNINPKSGQVRCATAEYENYLQAKNPKRSTNAQFESWITPLVKRYKKAQTSSKTAVTVITIPVVVHVIYNGQAIGIAPNITDAQVQSQITVLNQDYRKMLGTPGYNTNPVGADVEIQFALAQQDPNGNPTNGIDRISLCQPSWSEIDLDTTLKPATIWDPTSYMNMWSVNFTNPILLGYAQYPDASGLDGLDAIGGNANADGVVSNYNVFGSIAYDDGTFLLHPTYNKGRTMTHEVGHWLGLRHIWGDEFCGNDFCADTPVHHDNNYGCPTVINCDANGNEMVENYMDYTDDSCMNIFTQDQKARMIIVTNNSPRRSTLKTSTKNTAIPLYANDAEVKLETSCPATICGATPNQTIQNVTIYNRGTSTLTSATLSYALNGGSNSLYSWTGNLATNQFTTFPITINSASNGTIAITVTQANGITDQRASNNTASGNFIIPATPSNYTFTNYVFRLQQDYFGSETTWNLKNADGTILYSGGPYTDTYINSTTVSPIPDLITQNWILNNDDCYTFTINDAAGDGICCGTNLGDSGSGYYDIKSTDGLTVVTSGASFTSSENKTFTTRPLENNAFKTSNAIFLYPNPTKETLNINIPSYFGLPNSYSIYNNLGQLIRKKEVSTATDLTLNISSLSKGIYSVAVAKENEKRTLRFIKK